jgi:hypothetical protein
MNKLFSILLLSAVIVSSFAATKISQDPGGEHHDSPLEEIMEEMKDNMRAARKLVDDAEQHPQCILHIQIMQQLAIDALPYCPEFPGEDGLEKSKYEINFKRRLLVVADTLLRLELALHEGDTETAQDLYQRLRRTKKESHDVYNPEDEDE